MPPPDQLRTATKFHGERDNFLLSRRMASK
jgi:hypothetical protein